MSRTTQLKAYIVEELKKVCSNICYQDADDGMTFPYAVYNLESTKIEDKYFYQLEVDIWDNGVNMKKAEKLADLVEEALDQTYYTDATQSLTIDRNTRNTIKEPKPFQHVRLLFELDYYYLRG